MRYPIDLLIEDDGVTVTFPDVPEAITCGQTIEEARSNAPDTLETALEFYFEDNRPVPLPGKLKRSQAYVDLPPSISATILLHNEMLAQQVKPSELARRLGIARQDMTRILDPRHNTRIDTIASAMGQLGKRLEMQVV